MNINKAKTISIVLLVIACITFIVGLALSEKAGYERKHDISKISVKVTDMDSSQKSNGYYSITFSCEIKNGTKSNLSWVDVEFSVYNKSGDFLGTITSSFDTSELKPGKKITMKTTIENRNLDSDDFFSEMYNSDPSDFKFKNEVTRANFKDKK